MISLLLHESETKPITKLSYKVGYNFLFPKGLHQSKLLCAMSTMTSTGCVTYQTVLSLYSIAFISMVFFMGDIQISS